MFRTLLWTFQNKIKSILSSFNVLYLVFYILIFCFKYNNLIIKYKGHLEFILMIKINFKIQVTRLKEQKNICVIFVSKREQVQVVMLKNVKKIFIINVLLKKKLIVNQIQKNSLFIVKTIKKIMIWKWKVDLKILKLIQIKYFAKFAIKTKMMIKQFYVTIVMKVIILIV